MESDHPALPSCKADFDLPLNGDSARKKRGKHRPPSIPRFDLLPVHELCEQALVWQEGGFEKEAAAFARWLFPLEPFLSLWCPERKYDRKKGEALFSHLKKIPSVSEPIGPDCDLFLVDSPSFSAALTLDGIGGTSLGAIRAGDVEIRAFGPQNHHLHFGIEGKSLNRWTCVSADREVWLEMGIHVHESGRGIDFNFRWAGLNAENPLSLAFYVKAEGCRVASHFLRPKTLHRCSAETESVLFNDRVEIQSKGVHKIEAVPLAGEKGFWDSDFLISFQLPCWAAHSSFSLKIG